MQLHREDGLCINTHLYKVPAAGLSQHTGPTVPASRWGQTAVLWCAPCKGLNTHLETSWPWKGAPHPCWRKAQQQEISLFMILPTGVNTTTSAPWAWVRAPQQQVGHRLFQYILFNLIRSGEENKDYVPNGKLKPRKV